MRPRRMRGLGCLGCLPFGGLLIGLLPLIVIGGIIYFIVNRPKTGPQPPPPYTPPPAHPPATPTAGGGFCSQCGAATSPGTRFCPGCGTTLT